MAEALDGPCVIALDSAAAGSLTASGNATVTANCEFAVNSASSEAVRLKGIASIALSDANQMMIVGGFDLSGLAQITPPPITNTLPADDPFASLPAPFLPSTCDFVNLVINDASRTLGPGVYCGGILLGEQAFVTLLPGMFILQGGGLAVTGDSTLVGTEVTFYDTGTPASYQPIIIGHNASVQLTAPSSGPYAHVLIFANRDISSSQTSNSQVTHILGAGGGSTFGGALYVPAQRVSLENFSPGGCSEVIADRIEFTGDTQLNCP